MGQKLNGPDRRRKELDSTGHATLHRDKRSDSGWIAHAEVDGYGKTKTRARGNAIKCAKQVIGRAREAKKNKL